MLASLIVVASLSAPLSTGPHVATHADEATELAAWSATRDVRMA
jgi:hypothetical protein